MEILLGTNAECTRKFSHGIIPTFFGFFPKEFFLWKKIKFLRKDFDPSYLRIGNLFKKYINSFVLTFLL
jgi:hypothetical protein